MAVREGEAVLISINRKINGLVATDSESCIFRVHKVLRNVNAKAYEPEIVAIGPYHRKKSHLGMMKEHKLRFLKLLLQRRKDELPSYMSAMRSLEEKARRCYAESTDLSSDEFVEMMVIDGLFIIELMRKFSMFKRRDPNDEVNADPLFTMERTLCSLQRDLTLFENQLPFFVLSKLYEMVDPPGQGSRFICMVMEFFNDLFPGYGNRCTEGAPQDNNFKHLLDLILRNWSTRKPDLTLTRSWNATWITSRLRR